MSTQSKVAAMSFVPILLVVGIFGLYLNQTSPTSSTLSGTVFTTATTETANSTLGLTLQLSINSTVIPSEDAISVSAAVLNTLPRTNNLTASSDWAIQGLQVGPCNFLSDPIGFAFFRGNFALNNISRAGTPIPVWGGVDCPTPLAFNGTQMYHLVNVTSYSLLPNEAASSAGNNNGSFAGYYEIPGPNPPPCSAASCTYYQANSTTSLPPLPCNATSCSYYEYPPTFAKGTFPTQLNNGATISASNSSFLGINTLDSALPSNYTVVAGDEWGQIALLHFEVVASSNLPVVGEFLTFGGCYENAYPVPCITGEFSGALAFNCLVAAATASGCTVQGNAGPAYAPGAITNYSITVWYPYVNHSGEPASANCMFSVEGDTTSPYGYCLKINSTAFVISSP